MEAHIARYQPRILSGIELEGRGKSIYAFEVPITKISGGTGIVDCIMVAEYWRNKVTRGDCMLREFPDGEDTGTPPECALNLPEGSEIPSDCKAEACEWLRHTVYGVKAPLAICIELKASVSDFHSMHGHNFMGHLNYYLMPEAIYDRVKSDIPEGRGVLLYYPTGRRHIREARNSDYLELNHSAAKDILMAVVKANSRYKDRLPALAI